MAGDRAAVATDLGESEHDKNTGQAHTPHRHGRELEQRSDTSAFDVSKGPET